MLSFTSISINFLQNNSGKLPEFIDIDLVLRVLGTNWLTRVPVEEHNPVTMISKPIARGPPPWEKSEILTKGQFMALVSIAAYFTIGALTELSGFPEFGILFLLIQLYRAARQTPPKGGGFGTFLWLFYHDRHNDF